MDKRESQDQQQQPPPQQPADLLPPSQVVLKTHGTLQKEDIKQTEPDPVGIDDLEETNPLPNTEEHQLLD
jgi:hypothetical protein